MEVFDRPTPSVADIWGPRNAKGNRKGKTSISHGRGKGKAVQETLKDVFMIVDPNISAVPRRNGRQLYYVNNLVASAVKFNSNMEEGDIGEAIKI
jgi:hypothetical protein